MKTKIKTKTFDRLVFDILCPYDGKKLGLLISGGSVLWVLESEQICALNRSEWHVYFADERIAPDAHEDRNFLAAKKFLRNIGHVYPVDTSLSPEDMKASYQGILQNATFDLAILGVGEDGHVASIFPGSKAIDSPDLVEIVCDSPKPPKDRITVTPRLLTLVKQIVFLILPLLDGRMKLAEEPHFSILSRINTKTLIVTADTD